MTELPVGSKAATAPRSPYLILSTPDTRAVTGGVQNKAVTSTTAAGKTRTSKPEAATGTGPSTSALAALIPPSLTGLMPRPKVPRFPRRPPSR
jgi:hypothetical protein